MNQFGDGLDGDFVDCGSAAGGGAQEVVSRGDMPHRFVGRPRIAAQQDRILFVAIQSCPQCRWSSWTGMYGSTA